MATANICHLCPSHSDNRLQIPLLDHILNIAHWKELHLHSEMDTDRILEMLGGYKLEVLLKCILHISFVATTSASTMRF